MAEIRLTQQDGRVFIDMAETSENPCLDCGVCCSHFRISFYMGELSSNQGSVPVELTEKVNDFYACMKGTGSGGGRCSALQGESSLGNIRCTIYENRPSPCREFPVWLDDGRANPKCNELRAKAGIAAIPDRIFTVS